MPPRRGSRPGNQHRFAKTRPAEFCDPKLDEWVSWQLAARLAPATGKRRASIVDNFAREAGVNPVTAEPADLVAWFASRDDLSRSTSALSFEYLNSWFTWLQRMDYRADNPLLKLQKPSKSIGEPRPVSDEDLVRLLATRMHSRTRTMLMLAALAGMRVSEIAKVRGEDVDLGRGLIWTVGKGDKRKSIPLHPLLVNVAHTMPRTGFWFTGEYEREGQSVSGTAVSSILSGVMRRAGVPGGAHCLRHWYGSALLANGADLRVVQECLRHASVATTQVYTAVTDDRRHEAVETLDPWASARAQLRGLTTRNT
jgi:integrase/recombinase XerD